LEGRQDADPTVKTFNCNLNPAEFGGRNVPHILGVEGLLDPVNASSRRAVPLVARSCAATGEGWHYGEVVLLAGPWPKLKNVTSTVPVQHSITMQPENHSERSGLRKVWQTYPATKKQQLALTVIINFSVKNNYQV
jgi:hypothetical protein